MDPRVAAECAEFLGRDIADVEALADAADLLPALIARLGMVMIGRVPQQLPPNPGDAFCAALVESFGADEEFTARELLDWAAERQSRNAVKDAAQALCRSDCTPTSWQLGIALKRLTEISLMWFKVERRNVRGTTRWVVRDLRK